jgi:hypothetical protein
MIKLYTAGSLFEAQLLCDLLASRGIKGHVLNANAQGAVGEIPFIEAYPQVWIDQNADKALAERIVAELEAQEPATDDITCPHCGERNPGNFSACWACQGALEDHHDAG